MNDKKTVKALNEDGMDDLLRTTLSGHRVEPSPNLWKALSRKLLWRELARFNFTNLPTRAWISGVSGVLIMATTLYFLIPAGEKAGSAPSATVVPSVASTAGISAGSVATSVPIPASSGNPSPGASLKTAPAAHTATLHTIKNQAPHGTRSKHENQTPLLAYAVSLPVKDKISTDQPAPGLIPQPVMPEENLNSTTGLALGILDPLSPVEATLFDLPSADTVITIMTAGGITRYHVATPRSPMFFSANFEIEPEMSFYSSPERYSNLNVWGNAGLSWHFSRFSLSTGIGLGYVYDRSNYKVDYRSNDSVGFFSGVVSFSVGSNNEIIYNTVNTTVYDSLNHQDDYRTLNRYSYIRVPLLLGYRLFESGRFSMTFRAGPAVSFLLGERRSEPVIEYQNARIIRVDDNTPARVHTTWQVWGDLLLDYRLSRKFSLYFRPSCKYYLNPVAEQENTTFTSPWSAGLGVGIQFNFAPKKKNP